MTDLRVAISSSPLLAVALGAIHLAAAVVLWLVPLAVTAQALLTLAIAASLVYHMARTALLHAPRSIVALEVREEQIALQTRNGEWIDGDVLGSSYVSSWLTVINFRQRGRRQVRHVILVHDNVRDDDFRRLRTWMRWKGEAKTPPASEQPGNGVKAVFPPADEKI